MKEGKRGIIAPIDRDKYQRMLEWIKIFRFSAEKKYIYGAGNRGIALLKWLKEEKIEVDAFIDNNQKLQGHKIDGVEVFPSSILFDIKCKVIISPYRNQDIINSLKNEWGGEEDTDYFVANKIEIPTITSKKLLLNDSLFHHIRSKYIGIPGALPVYVGDEIVDYYMEQPSLLGYEKVLDRLNIISDRKLSDYKIFNSGILLKEWDELSELIVDYFKKWDIPVYFDNFLSNKPGYSQISVIKANKCKDEQDQLYFCVEQNFGFLTDLLVYYELEMAISYLRELENGLKIIIGRIPAFSELNVNKDEEYRNQNNIRGYSEFDDIREEYVKKVYADDYYLWKKRKIGNINQYYIGGMPKLNDVRGKYTNVINGIRNTAFQPESYYNKIHVLGPCTIAGAYVRDEFTIPSILQRLINHVKPESYCVENHGICGGPRFYLEKIKELNLYKGDYIIIVDTFQNGYVDKYTDINIIDLLEAFNSRKSDVFFEIPAHMNKAGNELIAQAIYNTISIRKSTESDKLLQLGNIDKMDNSFLENYRLSIQHILTQNPLEGGERGAIVMNCNPFTHGHLYLIDQSRRCVDYLFIFVVEEDKSYFPFELRFKMVKRACQQFENVFVVPSGKIILSSYTLPEYFKKESLQDKEIDPTKDIQIFASVIAPELKIVKRFVGEEPFDRVTYQYNKCMKKLLPQYGIELIEIPRVAKNGEVVSATKVRKLIKEGNMSEVQKFVPKSTYDLLKNRSDKRISYEQNRNWKSDT